MSGSVVADVFDLAADLIEPEGAWIQGAYRIGTSFCLASAVSNAAWGDCQPYLEALGFPALRSATRWNDDPDRTQAEVVAKLREAAALARKDAL